MSKYAEIFEYLRSCPQLANLWTIGATEDVGVRVVLPQGASPAVQYEEYVDSTGTYCCDIIPYPSVYEDYQINCYQWLDAEDGSAPEENVNVLSLDEVQKICDWITQQNDINNLPNITGRKVISVESNPCVPQIRYVTPGENTICYFVTMRIRYVNTAQRKSVEHEYMD